MTTAEKIIVRWLGAIAAGISGVVGVAGAADALGEDTMVIALIITAFITGVLSALTTDTVQTKIGLQNPVGKRRGN